MTYIAGFVAAVPAANKEAYRQLAEETVAIFQEFGAKRLMEVWGDEVPDGKVTDFRRAVKAQPDEVIVYSWHEYPTREAAQEANRKMIADPRMEEIAKNMPFDGTRMLYGGFDEILDTGRGGKPGYVDGALAPVPVDRFEDYRTLARQQIEVFKENGATRIFETWGDFLPDGQVNDFKGAVQATDGETVIFSVVEWPSKEVRDAAWPKIFEDPRMHSADQPQDEARRIYGGFVPLLDA